MRLISKFKEYNKKLDNKYKRWLEKPTGYDVKKTAYWIFTIYIFTSAYDFCLTYLTYRITPEHFFEYEISWLAVEVGKQNPFALMFAPIIFLAPLLFIVIAYWWDRAHYGFPAGRTRAFLMYCYLLSLLHMFGGMTNFVHLINLRYI
jgi:hypothetical protein